MNTSENTTTTIGDKNLDVIHVFPHSGIAIPEFVKAELELDEISLQTAILKNCDTGYERVIEELRAESSEKIGDHGSHQVLVFPYSRLIADANRTDLERIVPETAYTGEKLIGADSQVRDRIVTELVRPWQQSVLSAISKADNPLVVSWHSMDTHAGNANMTADAAGSLRPWGQVFSRMDFELARLKHYQISEVDNLDDIDWSKFEGNETIKSTNCLEAKLSSKLVSYLNESLINRFKDSKLIGKQIDLDDPYKCFAADLSYTQGILTLGTISAVVTSLRGLANRNFVFELRKDIVGQLTAQDMLKWVNGGIDIISSSFKD